MLIFSVFEKKMVWFWIDLSEPRLKDVVEHKLWRVESKVEYIRMRQFIKLGYYVTQVQ